MVDINLFVAFTAGLVSFLAPCVVPLLPAYLSYISGVSVTELKDSATTAKYRYKVLINSLIYVAGFSLIFVLMGLGATAIGRSILINRLELIRDAGFFIIFFGLYTTGVFRRVGFGLKEFQIQLPQSLRGIKFLGPFLLGNTFALAWTPCVGPVFASILALAATAQNLQSGTLLLFIYSLGISIPFLLIAVTIGSSYKFLSTLGPKLQTISVIGGILLMIIGVLMVSGKYDQVNGFILGKLG